MLRRMSDILKFIKGDFIILKVNKNTLTVDARNFEQEKLKEVASKFFHQVYHT
jgi:hypothetical protein